MTKHLVNWKPVKCKNVRGSDIELNPASNIDIYYRGTLLAGILSMPKKQPISYVEAMLLEIRKKNEAFDAGLFGYDPGHIGWYSRCFLEWISSLGYHIELTGDEFESCVLSPLLA